MHRRNQKGRFGMDFSNFYYSGPFAPLASQATVHT